MGRRYKASKTGNAVREVRLVIKIMGNGSKRGKAGNSSKRGEASVPQHLCMCVCISQSRVWQVFAHMHIASRSRVQNGKLGMV